MKIDLFYFLKFSIFLKFSACKKITTKNKKNTPHSNLFNFYKSKDFVFLIFLYKKRKNLVDEIFCMFYFC